ncbi:glycoside hydrolase family 3 N-terminal domain-containing protein, partial [Escherichia coli]|uniref:glycoside hydrolase family 3 N-terminal domain-containing protein n=2 Tax=Gammaproteobacteria TaxID=1236 RepID=UPI003FA5583F
IKRNPLGGRNFEYFSEDPLLAGDMSAAWIKGVQSQGVGTSLKHFAVNNHEHCRMTVDAIVDQRTLREIYLPAFERAVTQTQPWTVMCSYNKINGTYAAEHKQLLDDILVNEWGFEGIVVTDWGANNDRVEGVKNGQHLEMPSSGEMNTK